MFIMDDYDFVRIVLKFCYVRFLEKLSLMVNCLQPKGMMGSRGIVLLEKTAMKSDKASLTLRSPHGNSPCVEDRTGRTI